MLKSEGPAPEAGFYRHGPPSSYIRNMIVVAFVCDIYLGLECGSKKDRHGPNKTDYVRECMIRLRAPCTHYHGPFSFVITTESWHALCLSDNIFIN